MRSKAHFKSHPIHPMLIAFPIAFLTGAFFSHLAGAFILSPELWRVGSYLAIAGVISGLVAAVPGVIDYLTIIPPESSGHKRATVHMFVNSAAIALFALSWFLYDPSTRPDALPLLLEGLGLGALMYGGWLGGTLVYRNQISVDHRYADAGKWKEESFEAAPGSWLRVAAVDELGEGQMKLLHVNKKRIVLGHAAEGFMAFDDRCTHRGASLADGTLVGCTVACPWHGSQFDVRSGAVVHGPAASGIPTYQVRIADGSVHLWVEKAEARPGEREEPLHHMH